MSNNKIKWIVGVFVVLTFVIAGCASGNTKSVWSVGTSPSTGNIVVNIGLQQSLDPMRVTKEKGFIEEAFGKIGASVNWIEFQSGALYFEAMAAKRLDLGLAASAPVIVGQAADVDFKIIALTTDGLSDSSLIVPKNSTIKSLKDLKGKKVAVARGSSAWYFLYKVIDAAALKPSDLEIVYLEPNEAKPAFDGGSVDVWAIWDPLLTQQIKQSEARVLVINQDVNVISPIFALARTEFAQAHPDLVVNFLQTYEQGRKWYYDNHDEAASILAEFKKMDKAFVSEVMTHINRINVPVDAKYIDAHQSMADFLLQHEVIKKKVDVSKIIDNTFYEQAQISNTK